MEGVNQSIQKKIEHLLKADKGQEWLARGFTIVPNRAVVTEQLTASEYRVYTILLMHLMRKDKCFPSQQTIAKEAGVTRRWIIKIIPKLVKLGFLKVEKRSGKPNIYIPLIK